MITFQHGRSIGALALTLAAAALSACQATDVVAKRAALSMAALEPSLDIASADSSVALNFPSGDRAEFSLDMSGPIDVVVSLGGGPFLAAGLDPARLPEGWILRGDRLEAGFDLADEGSSLDKSLAGIVAALGRGARSRLGYHEELDHFGLELSPYLLLEWADEAEKNDKDLVLVLDPELIAGAGGDPALVEGWILADVTVKGPDGAMITKPKLLRPFQIVP